MISSKPIPGIAAVRSKGYRFTITRSIGLMPARLMSAMCFALPRTARMPAWILGWSVFTRPSSISGNPV